jgi:glyoxylase-like metal-dependent hydrolase (beta-lactamase superfamily II)
MTTQQRQGWQVLDARVWYYTYAFAKHGTANCVAIRTRKGGVVVLSPATGLSEAAYAELAQLGEVTALVATNGHHHLGMRAFRDRFPKAQGYAPSLAAARISKKNPAAGPLHTLSELQAQLADDDLVIREAPHTRSGELWAFVKGKGDLGYIWFASDILINMEVLPDALLPRLLFKLSRSAPGYRVFNAALALIVKDKKAVLRALLEDVQPHPPALVVPAHGSPVSGPEVAEQTRAMLQAALA